MAPLSFPQNRHRYLIFKDLWEKGFFLGSGSKFGGDFLVYPGAGGKEKNKKTKKKQGFLGSIVILGCRGKFMFCVVVSLFVHSF
jgi:hypothetical protein